MNEIINVGVSFKKDRYNSYLILGEKNVLIDTVLGCLCDEFISNIEKHTDVSKLDYLILNHTEQDRSGCVERLLELNPNITIISTIAGLKNTEQQINKPFCQRLAKSNATMSLGECVTIKFLITHNINWADSMMTYYEEQKALFSCDAFSSYGDDGNIREYFEKKLYPVSEYVLSAMEHIKELEIIKIYPGTGKIHDSTEVIAQYIDLCKEKQKESLEISIVYESSSGNTLEMVKRAEKTINSFGAICKCIDVSREDALTEDGVYSSDGVIFACPTVYRNISENVARTVISLNHYKAANKMYAAFGSHGWSGEGTNLIYTILRARHFDTYKAPFRWMFAADDETKKEFDDYINGFCEALKKNKDEN